MFEEKYIESVEKCDFKSISKLVKCAKCDIVLHVGVEHTLIQNEEYIRFDILSPNGDDEYTYAVRHYSMKDGDGLFNMFDDYVHGRIGFFTSGKVVQAFLLALYLTEKQFFAKHDFDFLDYYGVVNEEVVDIVNKESKNRDGVLSSKVSDGYGISNESKLSYVVKKSIFVEDGYLSQYVSILIDNFDKCKDEINSDKFCRICVNNRTPLCSEILMDETIGLPVVFHSRRFMNMFLMNMSEPFIMGNLKYTDSFEFDTWNVSENAKIDDMLPLCEDDGCMRGGYDRERFKNSHNFIVGDCETIKIDMNSFDENSLVASII